MQPFLGEIRMFAGTYEPEDWAFCDGRLLSIEEHVSLFVVIGTRYGGDGQSTFALPDLRGRVPIHRGIGPGGRAHDLGESTGVERVTLAAAQIPAHTHKATASRTAATRLSPLDDPVLAPPTSVQAGMAAYAQVAANVQMHPGSVATVGQSDAHENMQPYLCINHIIALAGIHPRI